jgi:hypothetical protein
MYTYIIRRLKYLRLVYICVYLVCLYRHSILCVSSQDARHPSDDQFSEQGRWTVLGMRSDPGYESVQGYLDTPTVVFDDVAVLENAGVDTIHNISTQVNVTRHLIDV